MNYVLTTVLVVVVVVPFLDYYAPLELTAVACRTASIYS